jgi:hypothetical protein
VTARLQTKCTRPRDLAVGAALPLRGGRSLRASVASKSSRAARDAADGDWRECGDEPTNQLSSASYDLNGNMFSGAGATLTYL